MKRLVISLLTVSFVLVVSVVAVFATVYSFNEADVAPVTAERPRLALDGILTVSLDFYISDEALSYLEANADGLSVYAAVSYDNTDVADPLQPVGERIILERTGEKTVGELKYRVYTVNLGVSEADDYDNTVAVRAFVSYTLLGKEHTVASDYSERNIINPYDAVYAAFCDRSDSESAEYPYPAGDGSYSSIEDLTAFKRIIASTLYVKIENDRAVDAMENDVYTSIYDIDYFDGVLTVSVEGGDVTDWLTAKLVVNGEERYFEIYEGRIRLII